MELIKVLPPIDEYSDNISLNEDDISTLLEAIDDCLSEEDPFIAKDIKKHYYIPEQTKCIGIITESNIVSSIDNIEHVAKNIYKHNYASISKNIKQMNNTYTKLLDIIKHNKMATIRAKNIVKNSDVKSLVLRHNDKDSAFNAKQITYDPNVLVDAITAIMKSAQTAVAKGTKVDTKKYKAELAKTIFKKGGAFQNYSPSLKSVTYKSKSLYNILLKMEKDVKQYQDLYKILDELLKSQVTSHKKIVRTYKSLYSSYSNNKALQKIVDSLFTDLIKHSIKYLKFVSNCLKVFDKIISFYNSQFDKAYKLIISAVEQHA